LTPLISSCSSKQIIKTEIVEVEVLKFKPLDLELTKDCEKITILDGQHGESDIIKYLLDAIQYNQDCTNRMNKIRELVNE